MEPILHKFACLPIVLAECETVQEEYSHINHVMKFHWIFEPFLEHTRYMLFDAEEYTHQGISHGIDFITSDDFSIFIL